MKVESEDDQGGEWLPWLGVSGSASRTEPRTDDQMSCKSKKSCLEAETGIKFAPDTVLQLQATEWSLAVRPGCQPYSGEA